MSIDDSVADPTRSEVVCVRDVTPDDAVSLDGGSSASSSEQDEESDVSSTRSVTHVSAGILQPGGTPPSISIEHSRDVQIGSRLNYNAPVTINQIVQVVRNSDVIQDGRLLREAIRAPMHILDSKENTPSQVTLLSLHQEVQGTSVLEEAPTDVATRHQKQISFCQRRRTCLVIILLLLLLVIIIVPVVVYLSNVTEDTFTDYTGSNFTEHTSTDYTGSNFTEHTSTDYTGSNFTKLTFTDYTGSNFTEHTFTNYTGSNVTEHSFHPTPKVAGLAAGSNFYLQNNLGYTVWVGILGNAGKGQPDNGGFTLNPGQRRTVSVPDGWSGRFWARTGCNFNDNGQRRCATGDCGNKLECNGAGGVPPATLAEITLNGYDGNDFYDISLVDGFNVPMRMTPTAGSGDSYRCITAGCSNDLNPGCPDNLKVWDGDKVVACKSSCLAYNTDEYCCRGRFNNPDVCKSSPSAGYFKGNCPRANSYAYDDGTSTFTCRNTDYNIMFG